jgi:uncharacterized membrane protein YdfJ with MMPL/SSD domain
MFGAGTDYCLLIVARFRDELRRTADVHEAMTRAAERTGPAILSAGAIVVVAMLALALADFNATREMGPILALGVAVMVAAGLALLPAILAALGRRSFWPAVPRPAPEQAPANGLRSDVARLVRRRPALTAAAVAAVLVAGALGNLGGREPLDFSEAFREERQHAGTADAVTAALARTGGVITSAGLVLAATFGVLMALEIEALVQVGFVVALGLLADTFLVRALLVPAIAILLGERNWWPSPH